MLIHSFTLSDNYLHILLLSYTKRDKCLLQMVGKFHATSLRKKEEERKLELSWREGVNIEKKGENDKYSHLKYIGAAIFRHIRSRGTFL